MERFGAPTRIMHDQGPEFENKLFHHLENLMGISRSRTTPYHPQGNGQCERMNQTVLAMLKTLEQSQKWRQHLNTVTHAYNCTRNSSTGYSPYFLMFGRHPLLPIDLILNRTNKIPPQTHKEFVKQRSDSMTNAYKLASENSKRQQEQDDVRRNAKQKLGVLYLKDKVLIRNVRETGGPGKLRSHWEREIYEVIERKGGDSGVVYCVRKLGKPDAEIRTVHRNMLLLCNELPIENDTTLTNNTQKTRTLANKQIEQSKDHQEKQGNKEPVMKVPKEKNIDHATVGSDSDDNEDAGYQPSKLQMMKERFEHKVTNPSPINKRYQNQKSKRKGSSKINNMIKIFESSSEVKSVPNDDQSVEDETALHTSKEDENAVNCLQENHTTDDAPQDDTIAIQTTIEATEPASVIDVDSDSEKGEIVEQELIGETTPESTQDLSTEDTQDETSLITSETNELEEDVAETNHELSLNYSHISQSTSQLYEEASALSDDDDNYEDSSERRSVSTPPNSRSRQSVLTDKDTTPNSKAKAVRKEKRFDRWKEQRDGAVQKKRGTNYDEYWETSPEEREGRPQRRRKAPLRFTYDTFGGNPTIAKPSINSVRSKVELANKRWNDVQEEEERDDEIQILSESFKTLRRTVRSPSPKRKESVNFVSQSSSNPTVSNSCYRNDDANLRHYMANYQSHTEHYLPSQYYGQQPLTTGIHDNQYQSVYNNNAMIGMHTNQYPSVYGNNATIGMDTDQHQSVYIKDVYQSVYNDNAYSQSEIGQTYNGNWHYPNNYY